MDTTQPTKVSSARRTTRNTPRVAAVCLVGAAALGMSTIAQAQTAVLDKGVTVTGQGSSFVSNFIEQCKADAKNSFGINVSYQATGSGAGRSAFINATNDFAASDVGFSTTEVSSLKDKGYVYVPVAIGGVAVIYRLPGITNLKLSGPTIAKIFSGAALKWNDESIVRDNPGVNLPGEVIRVIVRSDSSGTSNVFSDYLGTAGHGAWTKGTTSSFPVPAGNGIAQKGSDGVSNYLAGDQGNFGITYAETSFAEERKLSVAKVVNVAGNAVAPTADAITEAMSKAAVNDDGTLLLNFNTASPQAYPIATTSYLILPTKLDKNKGDVLRTFVNYSLTSCQAKAAKIGYAPLPANLQKLGLDALAKVNPGSSPMPTIAGATAAPAASAAPTSAAPTTIAPASSAPATIATTIAPTTKPTKTTVKATKASKTTKKK